MNLQRLKTKPAKFTALDNFALYGITKLPVNSKDNWP